MPLPLPLLLLLLLLLRLHLPGAGPTRGGTQACGAGPPRPPGGWRPPWTCSPRRPPSSSARGNWTGRRRGCWCVTQRKTHGPSLQWHGPCTTSMACVQCSGHCARCSTRTAARAVRGIRAVAAARRACMTRCSCLCMLDALRGSPGSHLLHCRPSALDTHRLPTTYHPAAWPGFQPHPHPLSPIRTSHRTLCQRPDRRAPSSCKTRCCSASRAKAASSRTAPPTSSRQGTQGAGPQAVSAGGGGQGTGPTRGRGGPCRVSVHCHHPLWMEGQRGLMTPEPPTAARLSPPPRPPACRSSLAQL